MTRAALLALATSLALAAHVASQEPDGMIVEGTLGSLPQSGVRATIQAKHPDMTACFTSRYTLLPAHGGRMAFILRVATDGSVRLVRITDSTVGDRETERCIGRILRALRFSRPTGGEAEVRETFEVPPRQGIRPPSAWPETRVRSAVSRAVEGLRRRCNLGTAPAKLVVVIGPGGRAVMAGASSEGEVQESAYDCVSQAALSLTYPDPGSYYAKSALTL